MNKIETGGPAFPILAEQAADGWAHCGMSLRDYFAAKAMQAAFPEGRDYKDTARIAYEQADAMLEARK